jgi:hypothetical protein
VEAAVPAAAVALVVTAVQLRWPAGSRWMMHGVGLGGNGCRYWRQLGDDGSRHRVQWLEAAALVEAAVVVDAAALVEAAALVAASALVKTAREAVPLVEAATEDVAPMLVEAATPVRAAALVEAASRGAATGMEYSARWWLAECGRLMGNTRSLCRWLVATGWQHCWQHCGS